MTGNVRTYTPKKAAEAIGCSSDTIRRYCTLYSRHLSDLATPAKGRARLLTDEDVYLLGIAKRETEAGQTIEDIDDLLSTVALPEALVVAEDEAPIVETSGDVPEALALLRQMALTLEKMEAKDERVSKLEADVEALRTAVASAPAGATEETDSDLPSPLVAFAIGIGVVVALVVVVAVIVWLIT